MCLSWCLCCCGVSRRSDRCWAVVDGCVCPRFSPVCLKCGWDCSGWICWHACLPQNHYCCCCCVNRSCSCGCNCCCCLRRTREDQQEKEEESRGLREAVIVVMMVVQRLVLPVVSFFVFWCVGLDSPALWLFGIRSFSFDFPLYLCGAAGVMNGDERPRKTEGHCRSDWMARLR